MGLSKWKSVVKVKIIDSGKEWIQRKKGRFSLLVKDKTFWKLQILNGVTFVSYLARKATWLFFLFLFVYMAEGAIRDASELAAYDYAAYSLMGSVALFPILLRAGWIFFRSERSKESHFERDFEWPWMKAILSFMINGVMAWSISPILEKNGQSLSQLTEHFLDLLLISSIIWFICTVIKSLSVRWIAGKIGWFMLESKRGENIRREFSTRYQIAKKWAPYVVPLEVRKEYRGIDPRKGLAGNIETARSLHFRLRYTRLSGTTHRVSGLYEGTAHCSIEEELPLGKSLWGLKAEDKDAEYESWRQDMAQEYLTVQNPLNSQNTPIINLSKESGGINPLNLSEKVTGDKDKEIDCQESRDGGDSEC